MMGNDWDLYQIVRSSARNSAGAAKEGFLNDDSFSFPNLVDTRNEVHDPFGKIFYRTAQAHPTATPSAAAGGFGEKLPLVHSQQQQPQLHIPQDYNENNRIGFQAQATRPRRKKQIKLKVRIKVETHSKALLRSWRKYGQKPIKGSPHPRSYYRCNRSKACAAKKQVELSHDNPDEYIVTYIGFHTHARPAAFRPTAGTTGIPLPPCSTSPTTTTTTTTAAAVVTYPFTPTSTITSIVPILDGENQLKDADSTPYPEDDDVILIPNNQIAEELFMAMHGFRWGESQSPANNPLNSVGN